MGDQQVQPDGFFRFLAVGKPFNVAIEIDNSTEPVDSYAASSIRQKLTVYHAYQERLLVQWLAGGKQWERPRFRVVFFNRSSPGRITFFRSRVRRCASLASPRGATTHDSFITDPDPLFSPIFWTIAGIGSRSSTCTRPLRTTARSVVRPVESPLGVDY